MPHVVPIENIASRYGLESVSEGVRRLGKLASNPDATTEDIAKLISADTNLTARLLRVADSRSKSGDENGCHSVEDALQRAGMGAVLLVAMCDPLMSAVQKTFRIMLGIDLNVQNFTAPLESEHVLCTSDFAGKAVGNVAMRLRTTNAWQMAARMLRMPVADIRDVEIVDDAIGELGNMVVGNFKSNLCDAGLNCKLSPPVITRTGEFQLRSVSGSLSERISLRAAELDLFVDLNVNPWGE